MLDSCMRHRDYVGTTANSGPDGMLVAVEVHYLPPTAAEVTRREI